MKKFIYPMQGILNIKFKLEEQEKTNYGIEKMKLNEEISKLEQLMERREIYESSLRDSMNASLNILEIKRLEQAIESIKVFIKIQQLQVKKAEQAVELAMARLNQAIKERKIHEKLREKAFTTYKLEVEFEERTAIDELVSFTHGKVQLESQ